MFTKQGLKNSTYDLYLHDAHCFDYLKIMTYICEKDKEAEYGTEQKQN